MLNKVDDGSDLHMEQLNICPKLSRIISPKKINPTLHLVSDMKKLDRLHKKLVVDRHFLLDNASILDENDKDSFLRSKIMKKKNRALKNEYSFPSQDDDGWKVTGYKLKDSLKTWRKRQWPN
jgi:hypothetical protein